MAPTSRRYGIVAGCALIGGLAVLGAVLLTAWALLALPPALILGVAGWHGVSVRTTLRALANGSSDDPGAGPAGLLP